MRYSILFAASLANLALASPLNKRYDLDHNGTPDLCSAPNAQGVVMCLGDNDVWSTAPASKMATSTSAAATSSAAAVVTSSAAAVTTSAAVATKAAASSAAYPTASIPSPDQFTTDNGTMWTLSTTGTIFSSSIPSLGWDKGRTSSLSGIPFWNFGDALSLDGLSVAGFSMGFAAYADTSNILSVNTQGITSVSNSNFAVADPSDPVPDPNGATPAWGMDTSNIAEVSPGVGIGFVWEIWRSSSGAYVDRGSGIIQVALNGTWPVATRTGPLITDGTAIQVGLMTILNAEGYIYTYANNGPTGIVVGRALVANAFDATAYEFLQTSGAWVTGIPAADDTSYGVDGSITSDGQGSILFSNYFNKYMLFTGAYENFMSFYTSDTPYGPWSDAYSLATVPGYGVNIHPEFSPDGSHKTLYISSGINNIIEMHEINFNY